MRKWNFLVGFGAVLTCVIVAISVAELVTTFLSIEAFVLATPGVIFGTMIFFLRDAIEDIGEDVILFVKEKLDGKKKK